MNNVRITKKLIVFGLFSLCYVHDAFSDTIYQWTDQWGQVRYSKTQVPGSMVSELKELPRIEEFTEQQKQQAMLRKMQQMKNENTLLKNQKITEKLLQQQNKQNEQYCRQLRDMLANVRLRKNRRYYWNYYYLPGGYDRYRYDFLEQDLFWQIREYCR